MKAETIEAVYENGGFHLVAPADLELVEGQRVRFVVEPIEKPDDMLALAARVYDGLTEDQIDSVEQHIRRIRNLQIENWLA